MIPPLSRADLVTILLCCFELLCSSLDSPHELLHPTQNCPTSRQVQAKCSILAWNLALVGCPLKTLHRVAGHCQPRAGALEPLVRPREESLVHWLHILLPGLFSASPERLSATSSLALHTKMAATLPGPAWAHVVTACLSHDFMVPTNIITQVGLLTVLHYLTLLDTTLQYKSLYDTRISLNN